MRMYRAFVQVSAEAVILAHDEDEAYSHANHNIEVITDLAYTDPEIDIQEIREEKQIPKDWIDNCPMNEEIISEYEYSGPFTCKGIFNFYNDIRKEEERHRRELDAMGNIFEWAESKKTANVCSKTQKGEKE